MSAGAAMTPLVAGKHGLGKARGCWLLLLAESRHLPWWGWNAAAEMLRGPSSPFSLHAQQLCAVPAALGAQAALELSVLQREVLSMGNPAEHQWSRQCMHLYKALLLPWDPPILLPFLFPLPSSQPHLTPYSLYLHCMCC